MTHHGLLRASDQEREAAAGVLGDAYAAGRLALEEFERRVDLAFAARTWGDLDRATANLPPVPSRRPEGARPSARPSPGTVHAPGGGPALSWFLAVHAILVFLVVLTVALAGRVTSAAAWSAYAFVPLAVLLPTVLGRRHLARGGSRLTRVGAVPESPATVRDKSL